ncbi:MAG: glutamate--cysteine ligase [Thermoleophilia bacterium]|nr:glutamate--cysteine ligase [Thermoleophilia bacterium]
MAAIDADVDATVDAWRSRFDEASQFTVGVEEELIIVDARTGEPAPIADTLLPQLDGDPRFSRELHACQVEVISPVCETVADVRRELLDARALLVAELGSTNRLVAAGTHPTIGEVCDITDQGRYHAIAAQYAWVATHSVPCGMHVHVAVPGADRALAVYNALRSYLPLLTALGANSPFLHGRDTGMSSIRAKLNESYPRSGVPPELPDWRALIDFERWGRRGGAFDDWTHFWWDLRLSIRHGTIEVRVPDAQTRVGDAVALTAVVQALVHDLATAWDRDGSLPVHDSWRIRENAWLAQRLGVVGYQIDLDTGEPITTFECLQRLLRGIAPSAAELGCIDELQRAAHLATSNGADHQRAIVRERGFDALIGWLADATAATGATAG